MEKTVSNTLRTETVRRIFPEAEFILLERDGLDVVESSYRQWTAPPERGYLVQKLRYFPAREWRYGLWFARNLITASDGPPIWGPRYKGISTDLAKYGVAQTCAYQWANCVQASRSSKRTEDTLEINYSHLANPEGLTGVVRSLNLSDADRTLGQLESTFRMTRTWPGAIPQQEQPICQGIVESTQLGQ